MAKLTKSTVALLYAAAHIGCSGALTLNVQSPASIRNTSAQLARGLMTYYTGNVTTSSSSPPTYLLPEPYYWWETAAMWGVMLDYWHYTNDSSYNPTIYDSLISNANPTQYDYLPPSQFQTAGNDDQAFWGLASLSAAEYGFLTPVPGIPPWVNQSVGLWGQQAARWSTDTCAGGLRWQISPSNTGYSYKNSISNGAFFQLSAALYRYTGNTTYLDWATKVWNWSERVGLISNTTNGLAVYDGTDASANCTSVNMIQWTINTGVYLYGAALLYNTTSASNVSGTYASSSAWRSRTSELLRHASSSFFVNQTVMYEPACEPSGFCNVDQRAFKSQLSGWMWRTSQIAPFVREQITNLLRSSATGAVNNACREVNGTAVCGLKWTELDDGVRGVGEMMGALAVVQGLLSNSTVPVVSPDATATRLVSMVTVAAAAWKTVNPVVLGMAAGAAVLL